MTAGAVTESSARTVLDGQVYNVSCESSSDFVIGRQTNFHAPVTIINCPTPKQEQLSNGIVLRDDVWARNGVAALQSQITSSEIQLSPVKDASASRTEFPVKEKLLTICKRVFLGIPLIVWLLLFLVTLSCIITLIVLIPRGKPLAIESPSVTDKIMIGNSENYFISKRAWGGLNATSEVCIENPVPYVVISHTAGHFCYSRRACESIMNNIQRDHISRTPPYADIGYNFLVGGDGYIYEGRGWGVRSPHDGIVNNRNIGIGFIGDFSGNDIPTAIQVEGVKALLDWGVHECWLSSEYILVAHSAIVPTLSPGRNVMKIITEWPHYHKTPKQDIPTNLRANSSCTRHKQCHGTLKEKYFVVKVADLTTTPG